MMTQAMTVRSILLLLAMIFIAGCTTGKTAGPFISAEPPVDSVQTRSPQTLRLYYEQLPDVPRSAVSLEGPSGMIETRGMHTMGANDLMMEINAQLMDGVYTVRWTAFLENDDTEYQGTYNFTVKSN